MPHATYEAQIEEETDHKRLSEAYKAYLDAQKTSGKLKELDHFDYLNTFQSKDNCQFTFLTEEDAVNFFEEQAKQGVSFFVGRVDANGNYSGDYMISSGDGEMIQGNLAPELLHKIKEHYKDIKNDPEKYETMLNALKNNDEGEIRTLVQELSSAPRPDSMRPGGM